jgi:hypothetical protein
MGGSSKKQEVTQKTEIPKHIIQATKGSDVTSAAFQNEQQALMDYYGIQPRFAVGGPVSAGIGSMPQARQAMVALRGPQGMPPMSMARPGMPSPQFNPLDLSSPALSYYMAQGAQQGGMTGYARGGYIQGPGTGRSDSIPATIHQNGVPVQDAALSDGEFVMTERAVRGAGNGDREAGAARMYEMMRRFEGRG